MDKDIRAFCEVIETWMIQRTHIIKEFNTTDLNRFVTTLNDRTRHVVQLLERQNPEFWTAVAELATNAATLTTKGAKIIADGKDVTNT
jgi:hypothetical protein